MTSEQAAAPSLDFAGLIRAGDVVVCGQATAEPRTLTEALVAQKDRLPPFTIVVGPVFSDTFAPERSAGITSCSTRSAKSAAWVRQKVVGVRICFFFPRLVICLTRAEEFHSLKRTG